MRARWGVVSIWRRSGRGSRYRSLRQGWWVGQVASRLAASLIISLVPLIEHSICCILPGKMIDGSLPSIQLKDASSLQSSIFAASGGRLASPPNSSGVRLSMSSPRGGASGCATGIACGLAHPPRPLAAPRFPRAGRHGVHLPRALIARGDYAGAVSGEVVCQWK